MGGWLLDYAPLAANIASMLMLGVWLFYTIIFYREFKRQRRPLLILHQARGYDLESTCLLVNLSKEPVHVLCVLMRLHTDEGVYTKRIRNLRQVPSEADIDSGDVQTLLKQGPLGSGGFLVLGSFHRLLEEAEEDAVRSLMPSGTGRLVPALHEIELRVIALHGAYEKPVGAERRFAVRPRDDGATRVQPKTSLTRQLNSRREMRRVRSWLEECFPEPLEEG